MVQPMVLDDPKVAVKGVQPIQYLLAEREDILERA
jgi:hypothetical protein